MPELKQQSLNNDPEKGTQSRLVPPTLIALGGQEVLLYYINYFKTNQYKGDPATALAVPEFLDYCSSRNVKKIEDVDPGIFQAYEERLQRHGRTDRQIQARLLSLHRFFEGLGTILNQTTDA